jgi:large subunit ribosomal protein L18
MVNKESRQKVRVKKHIKLRNRFSGTAERPRLAVFRSNNHMYAQIIDDTVGKTLVSASTLEKEVKAEVRKNQQR